MVWTFFKWTLVFAVVVVAIPVVVLAMVMGFSFWAIYSVWTDQPVFVDSALDEDNYGYGAD